MYSSRRLGIQERPGHLPLRNKNKKGGVYHAAPIFQPKNSPARKSAPMPQNNVNWGVVTVREHDVSLGCSPCCEAPLTLSEAHIQYPPKSLNDFEQLRRGERRHRKQLRIPLETRRNVLIQSGVTPDDIHYSNQALLPIRQRIIMALQTYKGFKNRPPEHSARELAKELTPEEEFEQYDHFPEGPSSSVRVQYGAKFNNTPPRPKRTPPAANYSNFGTMKSQPTDLPKPTTSYTRKAHASSGSLSNIGTVRKPAYKTPLSNGVMATAIAGAASNSNGRTSRADDEEIEC
eukprot:CAMPEP_0194201106 /NCGR_PEP_ID=MMETSP0156-20130528/1469_1 /TAXON_ID=33649 /ORGANISM="Thalassionema nitzschioides, Strain L26-B" /LENGTH=288 /DNA_ID=CAMNT_0038926219 /DNA_START=184 /DNA_END=1050 /DNA_ORIENTATION=-